MQLILFCLYIFVWVAFGFFGIVHRDDTDKHGHFKVNWRMLVFFAMTPIIPLVAKICGML